MGPATTGWRRSPPRSACAKGTAHGILRTLQRVEFVEQDQATGRYRLGAALLHLGTSYLDANELRSRSINWADTLAARSGQEVRIGMHLDGAVLVVHHVFRPDDTMQTLGIGAMLPLHATALGKVLLAYDAGPVRPPLANDELTSLTRRTIVTPAGAGAGAGRGARRGLGERGRGVHAG